MSSARTLPPNVESPDGSIYEGEGSYVIPSGSVNKTVSTPSSLVDTLSSALSPIFTQLFGVTDKNSAYDAQQAALLRDWQSQQNKIAMDFNSAEAAKNRNWQQMMSDTAHQREVADMMKAGLNPVLSVTGGNGASIGTGATAAGVTSSGAMSQSDKSASSGLVSLLGNFLSAVMQQQNSLTSAVTNLAISEKNNSTSSLIADKYIASSEKINASQIETTKYVADIGRLNTMTSTEASKFCSELSAAASKYAADVHAAASMYGSDRAKEASSIAASLAASASKYATDQNNANKIELQNDAQAFDKYMKQNYPDNFWSHYTSAGQMVSEILFGGGLYESGNMKDMFGFGSKLFGQ